jgi:S1-C subfamily serine protease
MFFALAGATVSLAACSSGARDVVAAPAATTTTTTTIATAKDVLAAVGPSIAYVETPFGTGSAVLIAGGYLVTNSHVVDPFSTASITFEGGDVFEDVPVVGSDVFADVAVLGPIATDRTAQTLAVNPAPEKGDDVYLVGFPGSDNASRPDVTISRGVVSRTRSVDEFHQTYFQTDASIGGGQSGGALVNQQSEVIGISGLLFADEFALALSSDDVTDSIGHIRDHTASGYTPLPSGPDTTAGTVHLSAHEFDTTLLIPPASKDRTIDLVLAESVQPLVDAETFFGDVLLVNQAAIDVIDARSKAIDPSALPLDLSPSEPVAPDTWRFEVPADEWAFVLLGTASDAAADVPYTSTTPLRIIVDDDGDQPIKAGDRVLGTIDTLEQKDMYALDLAAGETVTITASSPQSDALFGVIAPGQLSTDGTFTDDSELGLYGMDAQSTFTAPAAGTYRILVSMNDYVATGYALEVTG